MFSASTRCTTIAIQDGNLFRSSPSVDGGSRCRTNLVWYKSATRLQKWDSSVFVLPWTTKISSGCSVWTATRSTPPKTPCWVKTLTARVPTICSAPTSANAIPNRLRVTPTEIARRTMLAAAMRLVPFLWTSRLARRAPPQVQTMDKNETTRPVPATNSPSPLAPTMALFILLMLLLLLLLLFMPARITFRAKIRVMELTTVKMTWDHHDNQLIRCNVLEVSKMSSSTSDSPSRSTDMCNWNEYFASDFVWSCAGDCHGFSVNGWHE